ncbi:MAG: dynamin family protein [Actinomycetales bacterium]
MVEDLAARTARLLDAAIERAEGAATRDHLEQARARLLGPLRVAIAGKVKAGKSTLLNALVGERLAPTDAGECTRVLTWYLHGHAPAVRLIPVQGMPREPRFVRDDTQLSIDLAPTAPQDVARLEVRWPTSRLSDLALLDTPGIASIRAEVSDRTHSALEHRAGQVPEVDAVIYLLRHVHSSDARFLEAFRGATDLAEGTALNTIGVLSRADEIGSCRLDALDTAATVARRYEDDARLRRLCPMVVPVDGLLALAATALRERQFAALAALAGQPVPETEALLLSADRFRTLPAAVEVDRRSELLDLFGLFGVRLAVHLLQTGEVRDSPALAAELAARCGLARLRGVLTRQFHDRARILKARSAIAALEPVIADGRCYGADTLRHQFEELIANAHELVEMRLLADLRVGAVDLPAPQRDELERLLGGFGHDPRTRLDAPTANLTRPTGDADAANPVDPDMDADLRAIALEALVRWRSRAQHPLAGGTTRQAALVAVRTIEGIVASLSPEAPA